MLDYFNDEDDLDENDLKFLDEIEELDNKRRRTC